ncbi:MAG: class IV adenylate cyclase [Nanoarchaeota archaeon]|nr:class IV adenylate cyclase [Nanoarchaeota archaeon]
MKEVELKVRNIDKQDIIKKITDIGAIRIFSGKVIDFRFDTPDRDLSRQGKALRIRQKGSHVYLNLKGKKKSRESIIGRDEIGVKISNFKTMQRILHELGYIKIFELVKYRTQFRYKDITFDIDEYAGLDPILEIESDSYDKVREYVDLLQIQEEDIGRVYIREILEAKRTISTKEFLDSKYKKDTYRYSSSKNKKTDVESAFSEN